MTDPQTQFCTPSCAAHGSCWRREAGLAPEVGCTYGEQTDDELDAAMAKLKMLLQQHAVDSLSADDREERARWCEQHNTPGIRGHFGADELTFVWGGRRLATVDRSALFGDDGLLRAAFIEECPDHVPDKWDD